MITSRIQKGGALLSDMRQLVCQWADKPADAKPERFVKDILPKATQARAKDTFTRVFLPRFIQGSPAEAWKLCAVVEEAIPSPELARAFYYWITARAEPILYEFVTVELFDQARRGVRTVGSVEVATWIAKLTAREGIQWSDAVRIRVARAMLAALRDFGVLSGSSNKEIAPSCLWLEAFALIAWCLRNSLDDQRDLKTHPDWRLFLLSPHHVERLLLEAHQHGWLHYQVAGAVSRIEFPKTTFPGYVRHVLAR